MPKYKPVYFLQNGSLSSEEYDDALPPEPETILYENDSTININDSQATTSSSTLQDITNKTDNGLPVEIKAEPMDTDEEDYVETGSPPTGELLFNPLATARPPVDGIMEADSTQKFALVKKSMKKKIRRNHTHFRGIKQVKLRCVRCGIYLHSKWSYNQHMLRQHGGASDSVDTPPIANGKPKPMRGTPKIALLDPTETEIEDPSKENSLSEPSSDDRYAEIIQDNPLTTTQENIISQLKTFSCYTCNQCFFDRRHTLNHIRQHMPDLKPYTCIACLSEFSDRSFYKLHCSASFECAVKIALVIPREGQEKYFTCNMCLRPLTNREELLDHLLVHDKQINKSLTQIPKPPSPTKKKPEGPTPSVKPASKKVIEYCGPYMNGDPNHNHKCDLCGMIYRYKPNMFKHRELCSSLPENLRTSYRCAQCNMTYLVFKKFHSHIYTEHKKKDITCWQCRLKFSTSEEYLEHHETHRDGTAQEVDGVEEAGEEEPELTIDEGYEKPFNCALCTETFATKSELSEHRNLHLKVIEQYFLLIY